jgi:hypothetical protein
VLLKGSSTGDTPGFLGYCPQENALWLNLTVREHLEIFAAIKGMRKSDANVAIERYTGPAPVHFLNPRDGGKAHSQETWNWASYCLTMWGRENFQSFIHFHLKDGGEMVSIQ